MLFGKLKKKKEKKQQNGSKHKPLKQKKITTSQTAPIWPSIGEMNV